jgi:peptide/nickel transport system permease protein
MTETTPPVTPGEPSTLPTEARAMTRLVLDKFLEHRMAVAGAVVIFAFVTIALGADLIARLTGLDPNTQDILARYSPSSSSHWLGTDEIGRDVFIRLIYGGRISLLVAFVSAAAAMLIGVVVGSTAGYFGGFLDTALMRFTDALLALPLIPIMIILSAIDFGKVPGLAWLLDGKDSSVLKMIFIFTLFSWMTQARLVRSAVLSNREQEYVLAAKISGMSHLRVIFEEILPNVLSPVIVSVTLGVGHAILFEAALSFLGLGIQPPTASWGNMLNNALEMIYNAPSLVALPGMLIFLVVVSFNFLGDGLQDALDPKAIRR